MSKNRNGTKPEISEENMNEVEVWEPSQSELDEAERELKAMSEQMESSPIDRFIGIVVEWDAWESQRLSAEERYNLRAELPGLDRNAVVKEYLVAKNIVLKYETRMVELLGMMEEKERESVLSGSLQFLYSRPNYARMVTLKPQLSSRLSRRLAQMESAVEEAIQGE